MASYAVQNSKRACNFQFVSLSYLKSVYPGSGCELLCVIDFQSRFLLSRPLRSKRDRKTQTTDHFLGSYPVKSHRYTGVNLARFSLATPTITRTSIAVVSKFTRKTWGAAHAQTVATRPPFSRGLGTRLVFSLLHFSASFTLAPITKRGRFKGRGQSSRVEVRVCTSFNRVQAL